MFELIMANGASVRQFTLNLQKFRCLSQSSILNGAQSNNEINRSFVNRNPRNLERLRIAYKPSGYHLETPGRDFWHKLKIETTGRHIVAAIIHYTGPTVISASTNEWAIKKYLYKTLDMSAYSNLGRVLAERCLESGLTEIHSALNPPGDGKLAALLKAIEEGGVALKESPRFLPHRPWDQHRPEKPWEVQE